jgi:hypothetical protein
MRVVASVLVVGLVVAAGCGDDDDDAVGDLGSGDDSPTTTVDEEAVVLEAYYAGWEAFDEASGNPVNPDHPALAETMVDPALSAAQNSLRQMSETGEYFDGPPIEHSATVTELSETRAVIEDCVVDASARYAADGSVLAPGDPAPDQYEAVMVNEDGTWKRQELEIGDPCEP